MARRTPRYDVGNRRAHPLTLGGNHPARRLSCTYVLEATLFSSTLVGVSESSRRFIAGIYVSASFFLASLPPDSPRLQLPPVEGNRRESTKALLDREAAWGPRWLPTTPKVPRLKLPGGIGTQEHIYSRHSPRLMPKLSPTDPVRRAARLMEVEGAIR